MGRYFARDIIKKLIHRGKMIKGVKILVCGITFKEDCPDIRNSRVVDILRELDEYGVDLSIWDPVADPDEVHHEYGYTVMAEPKTGAYDAAILAVKHASIVSHGEHGLCALLAPGGLLYHIKEMLVRGGTDEPMNTADYKPSLVSATVNGKQRTLPIFFSCGSRLMQ